MALSPTRASITVVVPVYNNPVGLRRTLMALAERSREHPDLEVIIVNDGSTDDSSLVAAQMVTAFKASQVISTSNRGPSAARNVGAAAATGTYVAFLDANDEPLPGWLARFAEQADEQAGIVHCDPVMDDPSVRPKYGSFLPGCFAVARWVFTDVGGYDEQLRYAENTDLVGRVHAYCARRGLAKLHAHERLLAIHDLSDPRRYDAKQVDAMVHLLRRDADALALDPERRERLARIGAVSAIRSGQPDLARSLAWTAVRVRPGRYRNWARLVMTILPSIGRRRWPGGQAQG